MDDRLWLGIILGVALCGALTLVGLGLYRLWKAGIFYRLGLSKRDPGDRVSEEEIRMMVDMGEEKGAIQQEEKEMIENIFDFDSLTAEDVMIHRTDMVMVQTGDSHGEILETIRSSGLSRFPVYEEDPDDVIGILSTREYLLNAQTPAPRPLKELLRAPYFIPESVGADKLFRDMQSKKVHMAIVVDEYGGTAGLVTMEDLLEEIVGKIYDEFDPAEVQEILPLGENRWRIAGGAELELVAETLGLDIPESEEYDTLGGLALAQLDVLPEDGKQAEVTVCGMKIHIDQLEDHRVEWATVEKLTEAPQGERED